MAHCRDLSLVHLMSQYDANGRVFRKRIKLSVVESMLSASPPQSSSASDRSLPPKRGRNWRQLFDGRMRVQSMAVCSGSRSSSARRLSFAGWGDCVVIPHTGRSSARTGSDPYGPRAGWRRPIRRTTHVTTGEGT